MTVRAPPSTRDWLRVIGRDARSAHVAALLKQYRVSIDKVQWIHGSGRVAIPKVGVYLYLWKAAEGRHADVRVLGVEFSFGGMRGGKPYGNPLPFRIAAGDSLDRIQTMLQPRQLKIDHNQKVATAEDRKHRFAARFNSTGQLAGFSILANIPLRRVPRVN
jgi:hypothetical protein